MKLLILPLLLVGAGAGWLGLRTSAASDTTPACADMDCRMTVECTDHGTCLVTCYDAKGGIVCQRDVPCNGPCDKACETPCEGQAAAGAKATCAAGPHCQR
jgi:hypothetical protein